MNKFERDIWWSPAYDKRDSNPSKNYGIHGMGITFVLKGEEGGITFEVYTNWHLPHVQKELDAIRPNSQFPYLFHKASPAYVGGHWKRGEEGQEASRGDCKVTDGACFGDGSSLLADDLFNLLVSEGIEALWARMEKIYEEWKPHELLPMEA